MNGPDHYRRAEKCIRAADEALSDYRLGYLVEAQVHATLALAAATAQDRLGVDDRAAWAEVTS